MVGFSVIFLACAASSLPLLGREPSVAVGSVSVDALGQSGLRPFFSGGGPRPHSEWTPSERWTTVANGPLDPPYAHTFLLLAVLVTGTFAVSVGFMRQHVQHDAFP